MKPNYYILFQKLTHSPGPLNYTKLFMSDQFEFQRGLQDHPLSQNTLIFFLFHDTVLYGLIPDGLQGGY